MYSDYSVGRRDVVIQVHMQDYNAKHAQMKILPRYKVKTEGEAVRTHTYYNVTRHTVH